MRLPGANANLGLPDDEAFLEFVKTCFAQKRKMLTNNVRAILPPSETRELLRKLQLREDARAEQLSVPQLAALFKAVSSARKEVDQDSQT
jgi:16S rRNA (adenine1518-N6/adenine1519-N6)-dimethyltransferase